MEEGGGGEFNSDQGPNCRKETLLCSRARQLKTRPGCCRLSRHCLLNVGISVWMMAFTLAKTFLGHCEGNTLFFSPVWRRRSICFLISLRSWVQINWLHHKAPNYILRTDGDLRKGNSHIQTNIIRRSRVKETTAIVVRSAAANSCFSNPAHYLLNATSPLSPSAVSGSVRTALMCDARDRGALHSLIAWPE